MFIIGIVHVSIVRNGIVNIGIAHSSVAHIAIVHIVIVSRDGSSCHSCSVVVLISYCYSHSCCTLIAVALIATLLVAVTHTAIQKKSSSFS